MAFMRARISAAASKRRLTGPFCLIETKWATPEGGP